MRAFVFTLLLTIFTAAVPVTAAPVVGLTSVNSLVFVESSNPSAVINTLPITGLNPGETIVAIDLDLETDLLLGLSSTGRLLKINLDTGVAVLIEDDPANGSVLGDNIILEADPVRARLALLDEDGLHLLLNSVTGLISNILDLLLYPLGDPNFLQVPEIVEGAFDNLRLDEDSGILYLIDKKTGCLVRVVKGLTSHLKTIAPVSGITDFTKLVGFEILENGHALIACLANGGGGTELRLLNLLDGTTTLLGGLTSDLLDITSIPELAAGTFVVTNTNDSGPGSLRQAVVDANLSVGQDLITFNIPGSGPHVINVTDNPINIVGAVEIDGTSQPGYAGQPVVTLAPNSADAPDRLLDVTITLAGANISGLRFEGGPGMDSLLRLDTVNSVVANCEFDGNDASVDGIVIGGVALNNTIVDCLVEDCDDGLLQAIVGASTSVTDSEFRNNNGHGLHFAINVGLQVLSNTATVSGCVITGNAGAGVRNTGGIVSRVLIRENSIYGNGGLGIDNFTAGVTVNNNDLLDDLGLVGEILGGSINFPVITSAEWEAGGLRVQGSVNSFTLLNVGVDFYLSPELDPSNHGEARTYVGNTNISTDLLGSGTFNVLLPITPKVVPQYLTATSNTNGLQIILTIPLGAGTSEFSSAVLVPAADRNLPNLDWNFSGIDNGPEYPFEPGSLDDVDVAQTPEALSVIVRQATGRLRNAGWIADTQMSVTDVGADNVLRGKFYISASNPETAPLNTVPNFRIRLQNETALLSANYFDHAGTGIGGTPHEPFYDTTNNPLAEATAGESLRPSPEAVKPSLYRVDFDPIEVPAAAGTKILALFESFSVNNPADGTLALTEFTLATYPKPETRSQIFGWSNVPALDSINDFGGTKSTMAGAFNVENVFRAGRRPALDLIGEVDASQLPTVTDTGNAGVILDTNGVPENRTGVALWDVFSSTPTETPRVETGKVYEGRFLLSSDMPTNPGNTGEVMQGDIYLSLKTGFGAAVARTEIIGTNNFVVPIQPAADIAQQILPGVGNQMNTVVPPNVVPAGEVGTWYSVLMSTPLSSDIRQYANGDIGTFAMQPGPGENVVSARDISANVSVLQLAREVELGPGHILPYSVPNRAKVRVLAVEIWSYDQIDDGGYAY